MAEFTPVGVLAQQSQGAWDAMTDSIRKQDAYNALRKVYGPIAGDPVNALRMQSYGYNEKMNPLQLENQQLTNTGVRQRNDYNAQAYPQQLERGRQEIAQGNQVLEGNQLSLDGQKAMRTRGILSGVLQTLNNDPGDPNARGTAFDTAVGNAARMLGADPAQMTQALSGQRQQYMTGGKDAVSAMQAELDAQVMGSMSPKDKAALIKAQREAQNATSKQDLTAAQIANQQARTGLVGVQTDIAKQKLVDAQKKAAPKQGASFNDSRVFGVLGSKVDWADPENPGFLTKGSNSGAIGRAMAAIDQMPDSAAMRGLAEGVFNNVPMGDSLIAGASPGMMEYLTAVDQIAHNLPLDDLRGLKESGTTLGRVTNVEFLALKHAITSLRSAQSKERLRDSLIEIAKIYQRVQDRDNAARGIAPVFKDFQGYEADQEADKSNRATGSAPSQYVAPEPQQPAPQDEQDVGNGGIVEPPDVDPNTTESIEQPGAVSPPAPAVGAPPDPSAGPAVQPLPNNALRSAAEEQQSTAQNYQPQQGPEVQQAPPGYSDGGGNSPVPTIEDGGLQAPPTGPGAVTPQAAQVAWENVLPYLPELLELAEERRNSRRA